MGLGLAWREHCLLSGLVVLLCFAAAGCISTDERSPLEPSIVQTPITSISSGPRHVCAVVGAGAVQCWGANDHRQLGHDAMPVENAPRPVPGLPPMVEVSVGSQHSCARTGDGDVYCWGGRHGLPKKVKSLSQVTSIASGGVRTCAITASGTRCFRFDRISLSMMTVGGMEDAVAVSVGHRHVCGLTAAGRILCWGDNEFGQLGDGTQTHRAIPVRIGGDLRAVQIACGHSHTCATGQDGKAYCWGSNAAGQSGRTGAGHVNEPQVIAGLVGVRQVVAGDAFSCASLGTGDVQCWGATKNGHFVDAKQGDPASSRVVADLAGIVELAAGHAHACGRDDDGDVFCWGDNEHGQLGTGPVQFRPTPYSVLKPSHALEVVAGANHACALTRDGFVQCWGLNTTWQLGNRSDHTRVATPIQVRDVKDATQVTAGATHSCALLNDGRVRCWGANGRGQIGDERRERRTRSRQNPKLHNVTRIQAGYHHTCALHENGTVSCWGDNRYGQLGDGSRNLRTRPVRARGLKDIATIAAGEKHTCALRRDGDVFCWGSNEDGAIGQRRNRIRSSPVKVAGLADIVDIQARGARTCAVTKSSEIFCWGDGKRKPWLLGQYPGVAELALGLAHLCMRYEDGRVHCSGGNYRGQLGDGTRTLRSELVPTVALTSSKQITCGRRFSCSLDREGGVTCWGDNTFKQLAYSVSASNTEAKLVSFATPEGR